MFSLTWILTIGLAAFRLSDYQKPWSVKTWLLLALAYFVFHIGAVVGDLLCTKLQRFCERKQGSVFAGFTLELQERRLFWVCFAVTLMGVLAFLANVTLRGYIPYFSRSGDTYYNFYSKFHIFSVASTIISGLSYYTLRTQKNSLWKKIFLWFSILYETFLFPMLVVSRGIFLISALSLTTAIFYLHKKRLIALILCAVVIVVFYKEGTVARGYSETQLNDFFEPSEIELEEGDSSFQLPGSVAFLYSYLTVSHDNFNEAVNQVERYSYGLRQLIPFNMFLRLDVIANVNDTHGYFLVRPHLNTVNLIGCAYYDFGTVGVAVFMFLWAALFGLIQGYYERKKGPFSLLALGVVMTPTALCFFNPWMSVPYILIYIGSVLLMFFASFLKRVSSEKKNKEIDL